MSAELKNPPRLEQFNVVFDAHQDRILLRVRTSDGAEYPFWITRRFLSLLWPMLMKMLDAFNSRKTSDALLRSTLAELAHGAAIGQADFASQYQGGTQFPLGSEPILLARISLKPQLGDTQTIMLLPDKGSGINLDLDERLVHVFARLLQQAATAAEWGLKLDVTPTAAGTAPGTSEAPHRLH